MGCTNFCYTLKVFRNKNISFAYILFASLFSLTLAYVFGNDGYEAFVTIAIALGILISTQLLNMARLLFRARVWLVVKLFGLLALGFIWFICIASVILSISSEAFNPSLVKPTINWVIVLVGTLPFLMPRVNAYRLDAGMKKTFIGILTSLYSIIVLETAVTSYFSDASKYRNIVLVLAIQLQYLMSYAITNTNYLDRSLAFANNLTRRLRISQGKMSLYITSLIVGLPFILPLAIISYVIVLR